MKYIKNLKNIIALLTLTLPLSCIILPLNASDTRSIWNLDWEGIHVLVYAPYQAYPGDTITIGITVEAREELKNVTVHFTIYGSKSEGNILWFRSLDVLDNVDLPSGVIEDQYFNVDVPDNVDPGLLHSLVSCYWKVWRESSWQEQFVDNVCLHRVTYLRNKPYEDLQIVYNQLLADYSALQIDYNQLLANYSALLSSYSDLQINYSMLLSSFNDLQANYSALQTDYNQLLGSYDSLQTSYGDLEGSYNDLQANYSILEDNYNALSTTHQELQTNYNSLQLSFNSSQKDYNNLQTNYDSLNSTYCHLLSEYSSLQANYDSLQAGFNELKSKYEFAGETVNAINLMYVFIETTVIFVATTIYFVLRKQKPKKQT